MCGISGIWSETNKAGIDAMVAAMRHRGPDDSGVYRDALGALGMARLSIQDTSAAGHQPMLDADGAVCMIYNGEVFDFAEQRRALEQGGHRFASDSDTEVVLRLYLQHGDDFLRHLRGMFALAILDKRKGPGKERLLLARDPLGIKPLLYHGDAKRLVFASEMKSMLASGLVKRQINPWALHGLLAHGSVAQPDTIIQGVKMLRPGHKLTIEAGSISEQAYWHLSTSRAQEWTSAPYDEQRLQLRRILERVTRMHMVADVPIGAFLSGGIDSTVLVGLMAQHSDARIRTFSVGFGDESSAIDESDAAAESARFFGTDHTRLQVTGADVRDRMTAAARALDQPSVDGLNAYFVSASAGGSVKVAISGTGGDEAFAGYPWFRAMASAAPRFTGPGLGPVLRRCVSQAVADPLRHARGAAMARVLSRLRASGDFLETFSRQYRIFGSHEAFAHLAPSVAAALGTPPDDRSRLTAADELPLASTLSRTSALCIRNYLQNQLLRDVDAVSMAHSLEVRVPLLDTEIIDFALALPDSAKLGAHSSADPTYAQSGAKRILIDAARDLLPPGLLSKPKRGFSLPHDAWLRGPLRDILEETTNRQTVESRGLFDSACVDATRRAFLSGNASWSLPWTLMMTELWCRTVLDEAPH